MNYQGVCLEGGSEVVAQVAVQRSNFTMVPNILIDAYDEMSDACRFGFIKFMRLVRKEGCFVGSLRKLGKKLKIANMTINRMVRAWERFILVAIERLEDTDLVRITPLLDSLWGANTDHYMYAPAELREHVTNCDTHTTATDRVVTECVNSVTKRDGSVTNCDTVSQPQAQNGGEYITKSNEEDSKRLLTDVSNARDAIADAHQRGYLDQTRLFSALDIDAEDQCTSSQLYTCGEHVYKAAPPLKQPSMQQNQCTETATMVTPEVALQAMPAKDDAHVDQITMSSSELFPASVPLSQQEAVKRASGNVTRKPREHKKADETSSKCDTKEVHSRINARRGYALEERVDLIRENQAIKTWCHLHALEELDPVLDYLQQRDPYWSKPENKYRIGGITLLKETPRVLATLEKRKQQPQALLYGLAPTLTPDQLRAIPY